MLKLKNILHTPAIEEDDEKKDVINDLSSADNKIVANKIIDILEKYGVIDDFIKAYRADKLIYRGIKSKFIHKDSEHGEKKNSIDNFKIFNPTEKGRTSDSLYNFHTDIVDNMSEWDKYPKRGKSLICTSSDIVAQYYGNIYVVIPLDKNVELAVCPTSDFWTSFSKSGITTINIFNSILYKVIRAMCKEYTNYFDISTIRKFGVILKRYNYSDIEDIFNTMDKIKFDMYNSKKSKKDKHLYTHFIEYMTYEIPEKTDIINMSHDYDIIIDWVKNEQTKLIDVIKNTLSPDKNGFKLISYYNNMNEMSDNKEVYTESTCLIMDKKYVDPLVYNITRKNLSSKKETPKIENIYKLSDGEMLIEHSKNDPIPEINRYKKGLAIFMVGPPAVGKSTFIRNKILSLNNTFKIIDPDETMKTLKLTDYDKDYRKAVSPTQKKTIYIAKSQTNFIYDSTGHSANFIIPLSNMLKEHGYNIICIHLLAPFETLLNNLNTRDRKTPIDFIMKRYRESLSLIKMYYDSMKPKSYYIVVVLNNKYKFLKYEHGKLLKKKTDKYVPIKN